MSFFPNPFKASGTGAASRSLQSKLTDVVNVKDFGAVGDGVTNDAPAIQAAINSLGARGGTVILPPQVFRLASAIVITTPVRLEGSGYSESGETGGGTWLKITTTGFVPVTFFGAGSRSGAVTNLGITQTHATPGSGWAPTDYDFVFRADQCEGGVTFEDILFYPVNKGIYANAGGRVYCNRVRGQVFNIGILYDALFDVPTITNLHFWPWWSVDNNVMAYTQANCDGIILGRSDGCFMDNLFAFGLRSLLKFSTFGSGSSRGWSLGQAYADFCKYGIWVDSTTNGVIGRVGLLAGQGEAWPSTGSGISGARTVLMAGVGAIISFDMLWTERHRTHAVELSNNANRLIIQSSYGNLFNQDNTNSPWILASGTNQFVQISGAPLLTPTNAVASISTGTVTLTQGAQANRYAGETVQPLLYWGDEGTNIALGPESNGNVGLTLAAKGTRYVDIYNNNARTLSVKPSPASGDTVMELMVNDGVSTTVRQVSVGAADSGGTGFRILRVPN